ncbi:conserved hypothetical protein [Ricinus communis]|uniref:Uncharacterized protein n=1 Tax=Ricinus communis TaxID=3988 RepID=B9TPC8_RICCO|nr:conserved hypothetical protein [Ricinus communis]
MRHGRGVQIAVRRSVHLHRSIGIVRIQRVTIALVAGTVVIASRGKFQTVVIVDIPVQLAQPAVIPRAIAVPATLSDGRRIGDGLQSRIRVTGNGLVTRQEDEQLVLDDRAANIGAVLG